MTIKYNKDAFKNFSDIDATPADYVLLDENDNLIYKDKDHPYINIFKRLEAIEKKLDEHWPELG